MVKMANETQCKCKNCGNELNPGHKGVCPYCGGTGKAYEVTSIVTLGFDVNTITNVSRELPEDERKLWEKIVTFLKNNVVIDGFEIGFPSGVKIIFRIKEKA